jgi:two-component system response regulator YesN
MCSAVTDFHCTMGISSLKSSHDQIPTAFVEANKALQKSFLYPKEQIFQYKDNPDEANDLEDFSVILKKIILLINRIHLLADRVVEEHFIDIMHEIKVKEIPTEYIKQLMAYIMSALERELAKQPFFPYEQWMEHKNHFMHVVNTADHFDLIAASLISDICGFIREIKTTNTVNKESVKLNAVLQYIHENYQKVVSLDLIAEQFEMHPNSFSKWFKDNKGINFIDYLTRYRIDKSKEMLEQTEMKAGQIAEAVGFLDHRYFGQVFKKQVELTPIEYRALFKSSNEA